MLRDDLRDTIRALVRRPGSRRWRSCCSALGLGANALIFGVGGRPRAERRSRIAIPTGSWRSASRSRGSTADERVVEALSAAEYRDIASVEAPPSGDGVRSRESQPLGGRPRRTCVHREDLGQPVRHARHARAPRPRLPPARDAARRTRRAPSSATASSSASSTPTRRSSAGPSASTAKRRPSSASCRRAAAARHRPLATDRRRSDRMAARAPAVHRHRPAPSRRVARGGERATRRARVAHGARPRQRYQRVRRLAASATPFHHALMREQRPLAVLLLSVAALVLVAALREPDQRAAGALRHAPARDRGPRRARRQPLGGRPPHAVREPLDRGARR